MTAIGMSTVRVARSRRLSLSEVLGTRGIRTMPLTWAKEHKAAFLKETHELGYGPWATRLLLFTRALLLALSFSFVPLMVERENKAAGRMVSQIYGSIILLISVAGIFLGSFVHPLFWCMTLSAVFLLAAAVFEIVRRDAYQAELAFSTSWWVSERLTPGEGLHYIPSRLRERVTRASEIPGVRVYEETLDDDPLVYAVRGWGPFREVCYIGGYATGVDRIDSF